MSDQQNPQQPPYPPYPQYAHYPQCPQAHVAVAPPRQRNGLGVFGFFVAVIGLFIPTGLIAILGLLICLAAIGRPPRFFAMCGLFIGLLGTVLWLIIDIIAVVAVVLGILGAFAGTAIAFMLTQPEVIEVSTDMVNVAIAAEEHRQENNGAIPTDLAALGLGVATLTDPWGAEYRWELVEEPECSDHPGYDIISSGPDGTFNTADDIQLTQLGKLWENAFANFEENMEEFGERMERLEHRHHGHGPRFVINRGCGSSEIEDYEAEAVMELMRELEDEIEEQITIIRETRTTEELEEH